MGIGRSILLFIPIVAVSLAAQERLPSPEIPAFSVTGRSRVTAASASVRPGNSQLPRNYARWAFDPTLALYGVPISANVLLTTESDADRRPMNSVAVHFDVKAFQALLRERVLAKAKEAETDFRERADEMRAKLSDPSALVDMSRFKELEGLEALGTALADSARRELEGLRAKIDEAKKMAATAERYASMDPAAIAKEKEKELKALSREIADPSKLGDKLEELDLMSGAEKFLFGFQDLGIGVTYPRYSPLVLTGVPVNGAALEYSTGLFTVAGAGGSMDGPIPNARLATQTFDRILIAGKLGLGATEGTHFHLLGLYANDDAASASADSATTPAKNVVVAVDGRLELFDRGLTIGAEVAGSMFTRDLNAPGIVLGGENDPTGIANRLDPKISTSMDYAWSIVSAFNLFDGATRGKIKAQMIGPGYTSLGVPYLRTDMMGQEAELEQSLFAGQVTMGGYYKRNEDNIVPWKRTRVGDEWLPARTSLTSYGGRFGLQLQGLPYLRIEYAPFLQQTDIEGDSSGADNRTEMISASAGWGYSLLDVTGSTAAVAMTQTGTSHDGRFAFTNRIYSFNQTVAFSFPLSLSAGGSYTETELAGATTRIASISGSGSLKISDFIKGSLGLTFSDRNDGGSRLGFAIRTTLKLWSYGELDLRAERNTYESGVALDEDYEQVRFRGMLTTTW
jgi:hypothetical protein